MKHNLAVRILLLPALLLAACGSTSTASGNPPSNSPSAAATSPSPQGTAVVATGSATVGGASKTVLTDTSGMTLYYRTDEGPTTIKCQGPCATSWPPLTLADGTPSASAAVSGTLSVYAGVNGRQVLYNGHPLYRFQSDGAPGQAKGQGLLGVWFVATPDLAAAM